METMGGREVTNMMDKRKLEVSCVQETKWKGDRARALVSGYKMEEMERAMLPLSLCQRKSVRTL